MQKTTWPTTWNKQPSQELLSAVTGFEESDTWTYIWAKLLEQQTKSDKIIIRNFIAHNIPSSWKKHFKLKEWHRKDTLQDVLRIFEILEKFDSSQQTTQESRKPRYERNSKPKKEYNSKREKPNDNILSLTRKRGTNQRALASFFIMETTIGKIASTIPIPRTSKAKQGTGRKRKKIKRTEGLEKK